MKKFILPFVLTASTFAFADTLPSSIIGGGDPLDDSVWYELTETPATNSYFEVKSSTDDSQKKYAGFKFSNDSNITYTFTVNNTNNIVNGVETSKKETILGFSVSANFVVPSIHVNFDYNKNYDNANFLNFDVYDGATLTLGRITQTRDTSVHNDKPNNYTNNYVSFRGNNKGSKVIYEGSDDPTDVANTLGLMLNFSGGVTFQNKNNLTVSTMKLQNNCTLDLNADFTISSTVYISTGTNGTFNLNLNGNDFTSKASANMEGKGNETINVSFGEADADGSIFAFCGLNSSDLTSKYNNMDFNFTDYDPLTDFIYFKYAPKGEDGGLHIIGGDYVGQTFLTKAGEGEWAGWTQYYVEAIPEPSTYAIIFGLFSLGFATYRRRK